MLLHSLDLLGVITFAATGAIKGLRHKLDLFGVTVLGVITALGGGIMRDVLINRVPYALQHVDYVLAALGASLVLALGNIWWRLPSRLLDTPLLWLDALGLAAFSVIGARVGIGLELNWMAVTILGTLTAVGGGMMRDLLVDEVPLVLREQVYAVAAAGGAFCLNFLPLTPLSSLATVFVIAVVRIAAIHYDWHLPVLEYEP